MEVLENKNSEYNKRKLISLLLCRKWNSRIDDWSYHMDIEVSNTNVNVQKIWIEKNVLNTFCYFGN